jgi:RHS repeat-associated protein
MIKVEFYLCLFVFLACLNANKLSASEVYSYARQSVDSLTELSQNRARFYDPECGSFISKDPIGIHGGLNKYEYCLATRLITQIPLALSFGLQSLEG